MFSVFSKSDGSPNSPELAISNYFGKTIGNLGKNFEEREIENVVPIQPLSGKKPFAYAPVLGFDIPQQPVNSFRITYKPVNVTDQNSVFLKGEGYMASPSWVASSTAQNQSMGVDFTNNVFTFKTPSAATAFGTTFAKVVQGTDAENVIRIQNSSLAANDSLDVQLLNDGDSFIINNYNSAKTYDLTLQRGAERTFARIQLGQNEQQRFFVQDWANIARSGVIALVDRGFDGVIDSTITFSDFLTTSVNDRNAVSIDRTSIQLEAYPNPSNGQMTLEYTLSVAATVQIDVLNLLGQPVMNLLNAQQFSGKHTLPAELSDIQNGTYFLRIRAGNATVVKPVQIIK
jgi:Secretion system C-terminal sorting domain